MKQFGFGLFFVGRIIIIISSFIFTVDLFKFLISSFLFLVDEWREKQDQTILYFCHCFLQLQNFRFLIILSFFFLLINFNLFVCCFPDFIKMYFCVFCCLLNCLKTTILDCFSGKLPVSISLVAVTFKLSLLLFRWCPCFHDFSCSLKPCIAVWVKEIVAPASLYWLTSEAQSVSDSEAFSDLSYWHACSALHTPSWRVIRKIVCLQNEVYYCQ